ncbi:hypothetical protein BJY52DRAFT_524802 [Lactarius psammicola]|nr:hypothetical protein BJY52DRAFT_524802 [Lactarius psammicola]
MGLESQLRFTPYMLKLMAADELVALENTSLLRQRGYEVALKDDRSTGRRLRSVVQPMSKNTKSDMQGGSRVPSHQLSHRQSAYRF